MITKNINLDFNRTEEQVAKMSNQELVADYITFAVKDKYKEGLDSQWRRTWARIQRLLDVAIEEKSETITFENGEMDFIKGAFKDVKFPADLAKYVIILEDELERKGDDDTSFEAPTKKK